jgi:hypothetical protein
MKPLLILAVVILFFLCTVHAREPSRYAYPGSKKNEASWQGQDSKRGGVLGTSGIAAKGNQGKNIAEFPDVCITPSSSSFDAEGKEGPNLAETEAGKSKSVKVDTMPKTPYKQYIKDKETETYLQNRKMRERTRDSLRDFLKK